VLKSYYKSCGGRGVLFHVTSLHGLIPPPIKRSRILVSCVVVTVISVKFVVFYVINLLLNVWLRVPNLAGKFPFSDILRPEKRNLVYAL
jgi:hypothetical protein